MRIKSMIHFGYLLITLTIFIASCSSGSSSSIKGEYTRENNPSMSLKITSDTLTQAKGGISITVPYKVLSATADSITIEAANSHIVIQPLGNSIEIKNSDLRGKWVKK